MGSVSVVAAPGSAKILFQKCDRGPVRDPYHQVMPARVVLAEVYPADICCPVINDNQFLVIAAQQSPWRGTVRICVFDVDAAPAKCANHFQGRASFIS